MISLKAGSSTPISNTSFNLSDSFISDSQVSPPVNCFLTDNQHPDYQEGSNSSFKDLLATPEITPSEVRSFTLPKQFNLQRMTSCKKKSVL